MTAKTRKDDRFRLYLMGDLKIVSPDGASLSLKSKKGEGIIAHLAMRADHSATRERLATLFWGESDQARARQSLRQTLFHLVRELEKVNADILLVTDRDVALRSERLWVDVWAFKAALSEGHGGEVLSHYHGDLLENLYLQSPEFDNWLSNERQDLQQEAMDAAEAALDEREEAGETAAAIAAARAALRIDPYREDFTRRLMTLYMAASKRAAAITEYQKCRDLLLSDLGVMPEPETQSLYATIAGSQVVAGSSASVVHGFPAATDLAYPSIEGVAGEGGAGEGVIGGWAAGPPSSAQGLLAGGPGEGSLFFVGRARELGLLIGRYHGLGPGRSLGLLVTGERGIGKSHLVEEAARQLHEGQVVRLNFSQNADDTVEFVAGLRRSIEAANDSAILTELDPDLFGLLATIEERIGSGGETDVDLGRQLGQILAELVAKGWEAGPAFVICERAEGVNAFGRAVLEGLVDTGGRIFLCVLVTSEQFAMGGALSGLRQYLLGTGRWEEVALMPLGSGEQGELIQALRISMDAPLLTARRRRWLESIAEGNPGVLIAGLLELTDDASVIGKDGTGLPKSVEADLARDVAKLADVERRWLSMAAVAGDGSRVEWVDRSLDLEPDRAITCVENLTDAGLIVLEEAGYRFANSRTRIHAAAQIQPQERKQAHARLRAAIEEDAGLDQRRALNLALHAREAGDSTAALAYELEAVRSFLRRGVWGKCVDGATALERSLRRAPVTREHNRLLVECGLIACEVGERKGDWPAVDDLLERLGPVAHNADLRRHQAEIAIRLARASYRKGALDSATYHAARGFAVDEAAAVATAWFPADRILRHVSSVANQQAVALAERLEARRDERRAFKWHDDDADLTTAIAALALVRGDFARAGREAETARQLVERTGHRRLRCLAGELVGLARCLGDAQGDRAADFAAAISAAEECGDFFRIHDLYGAHGLCRLRAGDAAGASGDLAKAVTLGAGLKSCRLIGDHRLLLARAKEMKGERAAALSLGRQFLRDTAVRNDRPGWLRARSYIARLMAAGNAPGSQAGYIQGRVPPGLADHWSGRALSEQ